MARNKLNRRRGLLDKAIDAVSNRDEREAADEAKRAADAAQRRAMLAASKRQAVLARARAAEAKARAAEEKMEAAEKAAAEAKERAARLEREQRIAEAEARRQGRREELRRRAEVQKPRTYMVKSGDSLSKIAKNALGDANRWPEIFELNRDRISEPDLIYPDQELRLPS